MKSQIESQMKKGMLLLNLGTPDDPSPRAVGRYLREFLMDPQVIDLPWPVRLVLVNAIIIPRRSRASSELYRSIWTSRGSPLLVHLQDLAERVRQIAHSNVVEIAMRYGSPSIASAFAKFSAEQVTDLTILPLYPQHAESTTVSSREACERVARKCAFNGTVRFVPSFYNHPSFIEPFAARVRSVWQNENPEHLLLSFHGLPERHIRHTRGEGDACLTSVDCCLEMRDGNRDCYRAQCFATARALTKAVGIPLDQYTISFQSRIGPAQWIKPYTDETVRALALRGVRRLAVACPSFVADCLETIEEIGIRAKEEFHAAGGEKLILIPCPNSDLPWAEGVVRLLCEK